jgi:hypothetical protein
MERLLRTPRLVLSALARLGRKGEQTLLAAARESPERVRRAVGAGGVAGLLVASG